MKSEVERCAALVSEWSEYLWYRSFRIETKSNSYKHNEHCPLQSGW